MLRRLVGLLIALVAALLSTHSPVVADASTTPYAIYTHDGAPECAALTADGAERGPPAQNLGDTTYAAAGLWSRGASACSDGPTPHGVITYDDPALLGQVVRSAGTPQQRDRALVGDLSSITPGGVAAKDVPTVVFSWGRAPGIADNFDNAVANGAPTRLNRVDAAARDANRRAALRGQSPAPAGQSLDEYPFACSAQGGCGSFVRSVPVGEQSYQGGVLSSFFQRFGIQPGDPFDVMFGP
jgi:hypothetical protein